MYVSEERDNLSGFGRHCSFEQSHSRVRIRAAERFWKGAHLRTAFSVASGQQECSKDHGYCRSYPQSWVWNKEAVHPPTIRIFLSYKKGHWLLSVFPALPIISQGICRPSSLRALATTLLCTLPFPVSARYASFSDHIHCFWIHSL